MDKESDRNFQYLKSLEKILDSLPLSIFWKDRNSIFLGCNQQFAEDAGMERTEIIGKSDFEMPWTEEESNFYRQCDHRVIKTNSPELNIIEPQLQANGSKAMLRTNKIPFCNETGQVMGVLGTYENISEQDILLRNRQLAEIQINSSIRELGDYKYALDKSSIVVITDTQGVITYVNAKFCEISQYDPEELIGKTHRIISSGHHDSAFFQDLWQTVSSGEIWQGEIKNKAKDGTFYWVNTTIVPFLDRSNQPFQYLAVREDITTRKNAEIALAKELKASQSLAKVTQAIRQSLDTQTIFDTATKEIRQLLQADRVSIFQFEPNSNCRRGEFIAEDIGAGFVSTIATYASDRDFTDDDLAHNLAGHTQIINDVTNAGLKDWQLSIAKQLQIQAHLGFALLQGQELWGVLNIHQCSRPRQWQVLEIELAQKIADQLSIALQQARLLEQEKQKSLELAEALAEVERQRAYQQNIARQEKILNNIIKQVRQSLDVEFIFQATTKEIRQTLQCDQVAVYKFTSDWHGEFIVTSAVDTLPDSIKLTRDTEWNDTYFYQNQGTNYQKQQTSVVTDIYQANLVDCHFNVLEQFQVKAYLIVPVFVGDQLWGLLAAYAHFSPREWQKYEVNLIEQVATQFGVALQQAELLQQMKQSKEEADLANKAKSIFLANMSHELRTPLNAILGFCQLLQRDDSLGFQHQETLGIINRSGAHLLGLINDVLEMSKIEAGQIELNIHDFDLDSLLQSLRQMFGLKAEDKGLSLTIERQPEIYRYIRTDENKLRQILINLLSNAIKFTNAGKIELRVNLAQEHCESPVGEQRIQFTVADTGVGIAEHEQQNLFTPFSQTQSGLQSQEGTGLGLSLSRKLVNLMQGELALQSVLGMGTMVSFSIPVFHAKETQVVREDSRRVVSLALHEPKYKILVVEDKWESRRLLVQLLDSVGFVVREAQNGQEAFDIWQKWRPDLVWMDIQMPVIDGYQCTRKIRDREIALGMKHHQTKILALTASVFQEERDRIIAAGCDDFVSKPFKESVLLEKMKLHLNLEYIYQLKSPELAKKISGSLNLKETQILLTNLQDDWLRQLHQAALELNEELLYELITEITSEYQSLADTLKKWVDSCQFDQIIDLTKGVIS